MISTRTKKSVALKMKRVAECVQSIEKASGFKYPPYYVEPVLMVVSSTGNVLQGLGVLYARTVPIQSEEGVKIVVELSAPLVLYAAKSTLELILAHELLHYVQLIRKFTRMNIVSEITSSTMFEDKFVDSERAIDPSLVFREKRLVKKIKASPDGFADEKLNEKCRKKWIELRMPMSQIPMGYNQTNVSVQALMRSDFDPKVKKLLATIP